MLACLWWQSPGDPNTYLCWQSDYFAPQHTPTLLLYVPK